MNESNLPNSENIKLKSSLYMIPDEILDTLVAKQDRILELLEERKEASLNGYVSEKHAMQMVNKKATWFWQVRKTSRIPFRKIGKTIYYKLDDIFALLDK